MTRWYQERGLRFGCVECGACCRRPGIVFLDEADIVRLAAHLEIEPEELRALHLEEFDGDWVLEVADEEDAACTFLVDDRCSVHQARPTQCRTYPFWPEILASRQDWRREAADCPGIGQGARRGGAEVEEVLYGFRGTDEG